MLRLLGALAIAAALGLGGSTAEAQPPSSLRVFFLGNSLTATNDLPAAVARIASRTGRDGRAAPRRRRLAEGLALRPGDCAVRA